MKHLKPYNESITSNNIEDIDEITFNIEDLHDGYHLIKSYIFENPTGKFATDEPGYNSVRKEG